MPKRGQHDRGGGDPRSPFRDEGGPAGRHARTHDVRREAYTNPKGPQKEDEEFADDLARRDPEGRLGPLHGHEDESVSAAAVKTLRGGLQELSAEELERLSVLAPGTRLEPGSTYLDLNDPDRRSFTAQAGDEAGPDDRYVAKRDTDYELWNRLVGRSDR
jgi:hypothetical protein